MDRLKRDHKKSKGNIEPDLELTLWACLGENPHKYISRTWQDEVVSTESSVCRVIDRTYLLPTYLPT